MAGTGSMGEEDMPEEEEAQSPAITVVSKGIWKWISRCLPRSIVNIVKLRAMLYKISLSL